MILYFFYSGFIYLLLTTLAVLIRQYKSENIIAFWYGLFIVYLIISGLRLKIELPCLIIAGTIFLLNSITMGIFLSMEKEKIKDEHRSTK